MRLGLGLCLDFHGLFISSSQIAPDSPRGAKQEDYFWVICKQLIPKTILPSGAISGYFRWGLLILSLSLFEKWQPND